MICLAPLLLCSGQRIQDLGRRIFDVGRHVGHNTRLVITNCSLVELVRQHRNSIFSDKRRSSDGICARFDLGDLILGRRGDVGLRRADDNRMPGVIPLISQRKVWIVVSTIFNPHQLKIGQRVGEVTKGGTANLGSSKRMAVDRHHGKEGRISCRSNHAEGATKGVATENNIAEGIGRRQFVEERKDLLLEGVGKVTVSERWIHEDCMSRVEDTRFCMGVGCTKGNLFANATQRQIFVRPRNMRSK